MPRALPKHGLLRGEFDGRHLDDDLQAGVLEPVAEALLDLERDGRELEGLGQLGVPEGLPLELCDELLALCLEVGCVLVFVVLPVLQLVLVVVELSLVLLMRGNDLGIDLLPEVVVVVLAARKTGGGFLVTSFRKQPNAAHTLVLACLLVAATTHSTYGGRSKRR